MRTEAEEIPDEVAIVFEEGAPAVNPSSAWPTPELVTGVGQSPGLESTPIPINGSGTAENYGYVRIWVLRSDRQDD